MLIKRSTWSCLEIRIQSKSQLKMDYSYAERVEDFEYLGTTITNQKSIQATADWSQGMLIIWCRIFCLPVCYPKMNRLRHNEL